MQFKGAGRGSLALLMAGLTVLLMLASRSNAWATPPQEPASQTIPRPDRGGGTGTISPDRGGTAASQPGDISVTVPGGAVSSDTTLYLVPRGVDTAPPATDSPLVGQAFTTEAWQGLQAKPGFTFGKAMSVCIRYADSDLEQVADRDARRLVVQQYDEVAKRWVRLPTGIDFANRKACASASSVGWFALSTRLPGQALAETITASSVLQPGGASARIDPQAGGRLAAEPGIVVEVPSGGASQPIDLVYSPQAPGAAVASADGSVKLLKPAFALDAYSGSRLLQNFTFAKPATLCIAYSDGELAAAGGDPKRLTVKRFDASGGNGKGSWVTVPTSVDTTNRRVCTTVQYLSSFALTSSVSPGVFGDTLSEPRLIVPIVVLALLLVGGGLYVLLRSRGTSEEPPQER